MLKPRTRKTADGTHIGGIPKDVWPELFFDDPIAVSREQAAVTDLDPPRSSSDAPLNDSPPAVDAAPSSPGATDADWGALLSGEVLSAETKAIRANLNDKLKSAGKYGAGYKEVRVDAAMLTVLAAIAGEHPEAPTWSAQAGDVREVAAEIVRSAAGGGSYKPARAAFDKLDALLSGSRPPDLPEADADRPVSELVGRFLLMLRMERAFQYMKRTVNAPQTLKKESAKVAHEAALIAALAKTVVGPGFDDADLDDYQTFARELQQSGIGIGEAAADADFPSYTAALERMSKACADCHMQFKNN